MNDKITEKSAMTVGLNHAESGQKKGERVVQRRAAGLCGWGEVSQVFVADAAGGEVRWIIP